MIHHVIFAPDSYKGTLSAAEICDAMNAALKRVCPSAKGSCVPIADGGEGTVDCFLQSCGGEKIFLPVMGPLGDRAEGFYGLIDSGRTAVIEMAAAAGLPLTHGHPDPMRATTYGVGELILHALSSGAEKLILALGGSATNDGGAGMAAALGVRFSDSGGRPFFPTGGTLRDIAGIDVSGLSPLLRGTEVTVMCDVTNPLCGEWGASAVYGPQKGADPSMIALLDAGLSHYADLLESQLEVSIRDLPGAGAAGGMGGGAVAFLKGKLVSGIETVLNAAGFDRLLETADLVFTGEGRIDGQSVQGKAVCGVARRAKAKDVPVIVVAGDIGEIGAVYDMGVSAVLSTNRIAAPYPEQRARARQDIELTTETALRIFSLGMHRRK